MPSSFKVDPDDCGDWNVDAVSALQVFCQKNKLWMPKYISRGTSQWYVTESTMHMELWEFSTTQFAPTKKEAKQKCARAFYEKLKSGSLDWESESEDEDEGPNPALFKWWKVHPRYTLQEYCEYYGIELTIEDEIDRTVMRIGGEEFYTRDEDWDGNYKSSSEIEDELAKFYYETRILPMLRKQQREKINISSEDVLDNFPVIDMSSYEEKTNLARTWVLNQLCAKAHIPNPWYETYKLKDWVETKCSFPAKINMKSWREWEIRVVYMRIAGLKQKIRGEWKTFKEAQHDAARRFLLMIWEKKNN